MFLLEVFVMRREKEGGKELRRGLVNCLGFYTSRVVTINADGDRLATGQWLW